MKTTKDVLESIRQVLDTELFTVGDTTVTLSTALWAALIVIITVWVSRALRRVVNRTLERRNLASEGTAGVISSLLHYVILITGLGVAMSTLGIRMSALFTAGAVLAVGIGFAMQNITQNFVSGVILLAERAIRPGDVLEVQGIVVRVKSLGIRTTIVQTRDLEKLIVPNAELVQNTVKNYTFRDSLYRLRAQVGVVYGSDMDLVFRTLRRVAHNIDWRNKDHDPVVLLTGFGDNSVNFDVSVYIEDPWHAPRARTRLNRAIWDALKELEIVIAFPQVDVHLDRPVMRSLALLAGDRASPLLTEPVKDDADAEILASLERVPFLEPLSTAERRQLARRTKREDFDEGEVVLREGDTGDSFYIIVDGEVEVKAGEAVVATLEPGNFFGEMSLMTGQKRTATIVAKTRCEFDVIDSHAFKSLIVANPALVDAIVDNLERRRRTLDEHERDQGADDDPSRSLAARIRRFFRL